MKIEKGLHEALCWAKKHNGMRTYERNLFYTKYVNSHCGSMAWRLKEEISGSDPPKFMHTLISIPGGHVKSKGKINST